MAPEIGITKVNFALIAHNHAPAPWNDLIAKENTNAISFNPIQKSSKWNESNKPVKHCIKIESKKKPWNDVNSTESASHFRYDQKQREANIQSSSINLSVLSKSKLGINRTFSLFSDNLCYTSKNRRYNQMNISELRLTFGTEKKKWNEVCDRIPNEYFWVKKISRQSYQNERRVEQGFTVKSVSPIVTSAKNNKISHCQEVSFQTDASICLICNDINCLCKCHYSPTKTK